MGRKVYILYKLHFQYSLTLFCLLTIRVQIIAGDLTLRFIRGTFRSTSHIWKGCCNRPIIVSSPFLKYFIHGLAMCTPALIILSYVDISVTARPLQFACAHPIDKISNYGELPRYIGLISMAWLLIMFAQ